MRTQPFVRNREKREAAQKAHEQRAARLIAAGKPVRPWHSETMGGRLTDIPTPHVRYYDDRRFKRPVVLKIMVYFGGGRHYYATLKEDSNPVWYIEGQDATTAVWWSAWDDREGRGKEFSKRCDTKEEVFAWAKLMIDQHFPKETHTLAVEDEYGKNARWFYREGD